MTEIKFGINQFNKEQQEVCKKCPVASGTNPVPYCLPAELEFDLNRIPTYDEASDNNIDMRFIPEKCPNGYKAYSPQKIR